MKICSLLPTIEEKLYQNPAIFYFLNIQKNSFYLICFILNLFWETKYYNASYNISWADCLQKNLNFPDNIFGITFK